MRSRRSHIRWYIIFLALCLAVASAYYFSTRYDALRQQLEVHRITSSTPPGGSYRQALEELFKHVEGHREELDFILEWNDIPSRGELETVAQMQDGKVGIGLIQGDVVISNSGGAGRPARIFALAKLYDEVFVLFTKRQVTNMAEFCALFRAENGQVRTGSLGEGSQVLIDLRNLLDFYRCPSTPEVQHTMGYSEAAAALNAGQIDLAFMVGGYRQPVIRELANTEGVQLLALPDAEALTRNYGGIQTYAIPTGLFGSGAPAVETQTVSTPATLVISDRIDRAVVYDLADFIFRHKAQLETGFRQFDIDLPTTQTGAPVHPASVRAHGEEGLNWLVRNDVILKSILSIAGVILGLCTIVFQVVRFAHDVSEDQEEEAERAAAQAAAAPGN